jgi:hypothetical protein
VLLRRAARDNRYDKKLEARWEGPFRLGNLAYHGRSGRLYDLITGQLVKTKQAGLKDHVHMDDLQIYVSRDRSQEQEITNVERVKCERVEWKGAGAEDWRCIGKGGAVDLRKLVEMGSLIFQAD